jgi:cell filamentation protein
MEDDSTNYTPGPEENLLGISDFDAINEIEAEGISIAEIMMFELNYEDKITADTILLLHKTAFSVLYDWAGQWRKIQVNVGNLELPAPHRVPNLVYQFLDNLNYKITISKTRQQHIDCLTYAHYEFVKIHPFNNGNGRLGRILMNIVALKLGYQPLELYKRGGDSRKDYITALKAADREDYSLLQNLISEEIRSF